MDEKYTVEGWSRAFEIMGRYQKPGKMFHVAPEHDELFAGPDPEIVTEEDKKALEELGWYPNDVGCFSRMT